MKTKYKIKYSYRNKHMYHRHSFLKIERYLAGAKLLAVFSILFFSSVMAQSRQDFKGLGSMLPYFFEGEEYVPDKTSIRGYLSLPKNAIGKVPAVILIHEWWGLNNDIKEQADRFAKQGYAAFAVDLYKGKSSSDPGEARKLSAEVRKNIPEAFANLQAAVEFLKNYPQIDGNRIASVGWCFGGGWSYQMAKNGLGVKASVIYYGYFAPKDDLQKMRSLILGHFAENDRIIALDTVREFQVRLRTISGDHEVYIYPNTSHGFASRENYNNPVYKKDEADLAWTRTIRFLEKNL